MPSIRQLSIIHGERGVATLITSLALLLAITLLTFAAARVGIMEQRISANDYRAKQGFEAAQAGIEFAIASRQDPARHDLFIVDDGRGWVDTR
ncbi:MAG: pilus assembly PilX N-terminal domain-containing protein, partial [Gammaproteobacteria bacterium]|nr:pilus assembly PilX N-terminal domain-containing protein [Gammaproteobacteria bacterium]